MHSWERLDVSLHPYSPQTGWGESQGILGSHSAGVGLRMPASPSPAIPEHGSA